MTNIERFARHEHRWITVINPINSRLLLQACDNCGVVKSQNSVLRGCSKANGQQLISGSLPTANLKSA